MKKRNLFYIALAGIICCTLPICASDEGVLMSAVNRQLVTQTFQTANVEMQWEQLLAAHQGNAEAALEEFAGEKLPFQDDNASTYVQTVYANPAVENELWVELTNVVVQLDANANTLIYPSFHIMSVKQGDGYKERIPGRIVQKTASRYELITQHYNELISSTHYYGKVLAQVRQDKIQLYQVSDQRGQEILETLRKQISLDAVERIVNEGRDLTEQDMKELLSKYGGTYPYANELAQGNEVRLRYVYTYGAELWVIRISHLHTGKWSASLDEIRWMNALEQDGQFVPVVNNLFTEDNFDSEQKAYQQAKRWAQDVGQVAALRWSY